MTAPLSVWLGVAVTAATVMVLAAIALGLVRLARGPTLADRVVALDLIGLLVVALITLIAVRTRQPVLIDAAIVLALVGFFATLAYSHFIDRAGDDPDPLRPSRKVVPRTVFRHDRKPR